MKTITPRIPKKYLKNQRILTDAQIKRAKKMLETNSQSFVGRHFKVSKTTIARHCIPGMKERFIIKARKWDLNHPIETAERIKKQSRNSYWLLQKLMPERMKKYRRIMYLRRNKKYYIKKSERKENYLTNKK